MKINKKKRLTIEIQNVEDAICYLHELNNSERRDHVQKCIDQLQAVWNEVKADLQNDEEE